MNHILFRVFFFKQKTAYEMRISDWSSDVCSSDLRILQRPGSQETCRSVAVICARAGCTGGRRGFSRDGRTVTKGNPHEDRRLPNPPLAAGARRGDRKSVG